MLPNTLAPLLIALFIDALIGYPGALWRRIGHPVAWVGTLIALADNRLNNQEASWDKRKAAGLLSLLAIVGVSASVALILVLILKSIPGGWIIEGIIASSLFASRSLYEHVRDVAVALDWRGLDAARRSVSRIVGRDPKALDEHGVARAAIESLAENTSDGILAPVFWFALLGLPGLAAYKAINTADSMIGHRTSRYDAFGWASARLDDLVNLPASRLTAGLFVIAALLLPSESARNALRAVLRDAAQHRSPNAGWPESAMAGALGLRLAGPRTYGGVEVEDAYMGDGRPEAEAADIRSALRVALFSWILMLAVIVYAAVISGRG